MSSPRFIIPPAAALIAIILAVAYAPGADSGFRRPWISVSLMLGAALLAILAHRSRARGLGSLATLMDNGFLVASLSFAAVDSKRAYGLFFCAILAGMLSAFQGVAYGFSALLSAVIVTPPVVIVLWLGADPLVILGLGLACALGVLRMEMTRVLRKRQASAADEHGHVLRGESGATYRIGGQVGVGGMGVLYRATAETGRVVAVKCIHSFHFDRPETRKRLFREARIVNSVMHEGVVPITDHGTADDGAPFLVMELLKGRTLAQRLDASGGRLVWTEVARIAERVLDVLAAAHSQGIVHCDVKPSNIFVCDDGRVRLLDFGIARPPEGLLNTTLSIHVAGTPACMAPEQVLAPATVDARADLWAIAATMFRAITGEWPRLLPEPCGSLVDAARIPARPIESLAPALPAELSLAVNAALRLDPGARWVSAGAMRRSLLAAMGGSEKGDSRGILHARRASEQAQ